MNDETPAPGPEENAPEEPTPAPEHDMATVTAGAGDFTSGEGLVAFAGIVLVAGWVIFELIADEYFFAWVILLLAVAAAVLPRLDRAEVEKAHPLPVMMKWIGYGIAVVSVFNLIEDLRFGAYEDAVSVLGALVAYAAGVMAFIGARQIKT